MQSHSNPVDWASWWRNRRSDIDRPDRMVVRLGDRWRCLLCQQTVVGNRDDHHQAHMLELAQWQARDDTGGMITPDSVRRSEQRRRKRQDAIDRAADLGEDPYLVAVTRVEPNTQRRVRHKRLRHPRAETEARIRDLHRRGMMDSAIAKDMQVSRQYVRRILRQMGVEVPPKQASTPHNHAPDRDVPVHPDQQGV